MEFQTDLILNYTDGSQMYFSNVHPDNRFATENGNLSFEDADGEKIHYIPAINIRNFYTVCVRSHD